MRCASSHRVPPAIDCWLSKRPIVSKEVRPMPDVPYRGTLMAQFAQPVVVRERNVLRAPVQHFPLFANVAPGRSRRNRSLGAPVRVLTLSDLPRRPSSPRRGHGHVWQREDRPQNGTEVIVRLGGRGEIVEVIRFCGILLPARAQYREYGRPATSRATGVFSRGFWRTWCTD